MKSGIYCIINKVNGKCYIGSAINISRRLIAHRYNLNKNIHDNIYLQSSWNKYKKENFEFIVLEYVEKEKLIEKEQEYLDLFYSYDRRHGYNIRLKAKSQIGFKHSIKFKERVSLRMKGNGYALGRKHSNEFKQNMSIREKGNKHALGYKYTEEQKRNRSDRLKGNKHTLGFSPSAETRIKLSNVSKGKPRYDLRGRKLSEEHKRKISESNKGRIVSEITKRKIGIANKLNNIYCLF